MIYITTYYIMLYKLRGGVKKWSHYIYIIINMINRLASLAEPHKKASLITRDS